jgi:hypothetical protein
MTLAVTFSFGLIKIHRMFRQKKRYLVFTALGNFAMSCLILDVAYFVYHETETLKPGIWTTWPFGGLWVGKVYVPWWWFAATAWCLAMFYLAYRSALYNLLLEREVEQRLATQQPTEPAHQPEPEISPPTETVVTIEKPTAEEEIRRRLLVKKALRDA